MMPSRSLLLCIGLSAGCGSPAEKDSCGAESGLYLTTTTDYTVGALATLGPGGELDDQLATVSGDPILRWADGLFQLNRSNADTVRFYEAGALCRAEWETALGPGANAHDIERVGDELWVAQYDLADLAVLDLQGERVGAVDLSELADGDGLPEIHDLVTVDGRLFVGAQRFDREDGWRALPGRVAELDRSGQVLQSWEVGPSPRIYASGDGGLLVLDGTYGVPDGELSSLDPDTGQREVWLTEADVGLDFEGLAAVGGQLVMGAASFDLADPDTVETAALVCLDRGGGDWRVGARAAGWYVDLASDGEVVWVGVRTGWGSGSEPGLGRVDPIACEPVGQRIQTALEPYSLLAVEKG